MLVASPFELVVKTMFPFELSFIDVTLMIAITVLIIFYVTLLLRLRPSTKPTLEAHLEEETHIEAETRIEEETASEKPALASTPTGHLQNLLKVQEEPRTSGETAKTSEKLFVPVESQAASEEPAVSPKTEAVQEVPRMPQFAKSFEAPKVEDEPSLVEPSKLSSAGHSACPHYFGYLKKLPKNVPIPDECLGCLRIVECLHSSPVPE
jgi:hypothetical protein